MSPKQARDSVISGIARGTPPFLVASLAWLVPALLVPTTVLAQQMDMPNGMAMPSGGAAAEKPAPTPQEAKTDDTDSMSGMPGMNMGTDSAMTMMSGALGNYSMMRDASGTSWQPDSTPMEGIDGEIAGWKTMLHGYITGVFDHQSGLRGDESVFSSSMLMGMAQNSAGPGTLTLRAMLSFDPFMGKRGYPLLLQTGETADGVRPLIDRQHPHDFLMELAGTFSVPLNAIGKDVSAFAYFGYPGEPALGPPTFMHRFSGVDFPAAPITHHWLDSTHVTFGVVTLGLVDGDWKLEGSLFNGREPDQFRWDFDSLKLDSGSVRLSWNPDANWALQASYAFIKGPEQLDPSINQHRITASASYNVSLEHGNWQTTFAWGRNIEQPGPTLDALLLESAASWNQHTLFARVENVQKNELFVPPSSLAGRVFRVSEFSLGYIYDVSVLEHLALGFGAMGTVDFLPSTVEPSYGSDPVSYMAFMRLKIR
jgi:hypothetical protein